MKPERFSAVYSCIKKQPPTVINVCIRTQWMKVGYRVSDWRNWLCLGEWKLGKDKSLGGEAEFLAQILSALYLRSPLLPFHLFPLHLPLLFFLILLLFLFLSPPPALSHPTPKNYAYTTSNAVTLC